MGLEKLHRNFSSSFWFFLASRLGWRPFLPFPYPKCRRGPKVGRHKYIRSQPTLLYSSPIHCSKISSFSLSLSLYSTTQFTGWKRERTSPKLRGEREEESAKVAETRLFWFFGLRTRGGKRRRRRGRRKILDFSSISSDQEFGFASCAASVFSHLDLDAKFAVIEYF